MQTSPRMITLTQKANPAPPKAKGEAHKSAAEAEKDASHTVGKLGPYAVSSSGGISSDDPRRTQGNYDQTMGSAKQALGGLVGSESMQQEGQQQNASGKGMKAEGQLADFGSGLKDRAQGAIQGGVAGLTGDREKQEKYQTMHDDAKTKQRSAEQDMQKVAEAQK